MPVSVELVWIYTYTWDNEQQNERHNFKNWSGCDLEICDSVEKIVSFRIFISVEVEFFGKTIDSNRICIEWYSTRVFNDMCIACMETISSNPLICTFFHSLFFYRVIHGMRVYGGIIHQHAELWTNAEQTRIFDGGWDNDILIKVIVFNLPN